MTEMQPKSLALALQGGGAHGAFTWGVLDRLVEDERIAIDGISGASAGAVNAAVLATGLLAGGRDGARASLETLWRRVSGLTRFNPLNTGPVGRLARRLDREGAPSQIAIELLTRVFSPYQLNPFDINPLREILNELIDVEALRRAEALPLFIAATNVATGRVRIFENADLSVDTLLASACLPQLNQALRIDDNFYWDGGFAANPPLFPLIAQGRAADILIVQVEAPQREALPTSAAEIRNRLSQIVFNATLLREIDALAYMRQMCDSLLPTRNKLARRIRKLHLHSVDGGGAMTELSASSKLTPDRHFVERLRDLGRAQAEAWLARNFAALGERSTIDLGGDGVAAGSAS
ncbi:MAG TPA: patatin-like phospholipase family protein [Alphaproteobacteria bacterium]|jgi:NTE family protein|nr:patatin-like phospholipase family protein [Alphaproteobacteria bacterium]